METSNLIYAALGWVAGLIGGICAPLIVDKVKKHIQKKELKKGISTELREVRFRLVLNVHQIGLRFGTYDRKLINWAYTIFVEDKNMGFEDDELEQRLKDLLKKRDDEIDAEVKYSRASKPEGMVFLVKSFSLPFLDSHLNLLSIFDIDIQRLIFQIRGRLDLLNQEIETNRFFFEKTFDKSLSPEDYQSIIKNSRVSYLLMGRLSYQTAELITKLLKSSKLKV